MLVYMPFQTPAKRSNNIYTYVRSDTVMSSPLPGLVQVQARQ